jgi:hypothetical protein
MAESAYEHGRELNVFEQCLAIPKAPSAADQLHTLSLRNGISSILIFLMPTAGQ